MTLHSALLAGVPILAALGLIVPAQAASRPPPVRLEKSPISASTLLIRGLKNGTIHLPMLAGHGATAGARPSLNCNPGPCALPNVEGSTGATEPVDETPIAVNPLLARRSTHFVALSLL